MEVFIWVWRKIWDSSEVLPVLYLSGFGFPLLVKIWREAQEASQRYCGKNTDSLLFEPAQSHGPLSLSNIIIQHHDGDQQLYKDQCGHKAF